MAHGATRRLLPTGTVTFLFTDIEGSTRLLQGLADRYRPVLEEHARVIRAAIVDHRGTEVSTDGDAFFAVFPFAPEALAAAVDAERRLAEVDWPAEAVVRVRIGLHTGEGRLGADDYVGMDVHRAARIAAAAHGGQVVLSDATRALVSGTLPSGVALRDLGVHRFKDLNEPQRIYQLVIDGLPSDFPPLRSLGAQPNNLPLEPTGFLGRRRELDELVDLMQARRLVTLTGPGGVGKTRLAIEAARAVLPQLSDGVFFVPLETATERAIVASGIATALSVRETPTGDLEWALLERLRDSELLLILDNFEQVVAAAPLVARMLGDAPRLRALVTSRTPLHLSGEQEYQLPPLNFPAADGGLSPSDLDAYDAVRLFIERARQVDPAFALDDSNADAVVEICRRLDGLPLAIEIAAARVKLLPPPAILQRLEQQLPFLVTGTRDSPNRHRTMHAAIDWSHDLLTEGERELFARLSVFAGGWTVDAAEFVCGADAIDQDVLAGLGSLIDNSLIRRQRAGPAGEARFAMLQVIRHYAMQRLAERAELDQIARRHAAFVLSRFEGEDLEGRAGPASMEIENLRVALAWAIENEEADTALRLVGATWRLWQEAGKLKEGRERTEAALRLAGSTAHSTGRAAALTALGGLMYWQGDNDELEPVYGEALAIYTELDERPLIADALRNLAFARLGREEHAAARDLLGRSAEMFEELGHRGQMATSLADLAYVEALQGDETAAARLMQAAAIHRELGMKFRYANDLGWLGTIHMLRGEHQAAQEALVESLSLNADGGDLGRLAIAFRSLARVALDTGDPERAVRLGAVAARLSERSETSLAEAIVHAGDPLADARDILSPDRYAEFLAEGNAMSIEEALGYAALTS